MSLSPEIVVYSGRSMYPTLCEPDLMEIMPCGSRIRRGDVLFFRVPGREKPVVHRVMAVTPAGLRTRGDNCPADDGWLVAPEAVIGQVAAAVRPDRRRRLLQGLGGLAWARLCHAVLPSGRWLAGRAAALLHRPYHSLAKQGFFRRLLPARWRPYRAVFQAGGQPVHRILLGKQVIAEYDPHSSDWRIRRPFRLFIDPRDLELVP